MSPGYHPLVPARPPARWRRRIAKLEPWSGEVIAELEANGTWRFELWAHPTGATFQRVAFRVDGAVREWRGRTLRADEEAAQSEDRVAHIHRTVIVRVGVGGFQADGWRSTDPEEAAESYDVRDAHSPHHPSCRRE